MPDLSGWDPGDDEAGGTPTLWTRRLDSYRRFDNHEETGSPPAKWVCIKHPNADALKFLIKTQLRSPPSREPSDTGSGV